MHKVIILAVEILRPVMSKEFIFLSPTCLLPVNSLGHGYTNNELDEEACLYPTKRAITLYKQPETQAGHKKTNKEASMHAKTPQHPLPP